MATAVANSLNNRMMTWWIILRIALEERLVYRGDFAIGTFMRFLPIVTQIFLWSAVFDSLSGNSATGAGTVAGYSFPDMVAYYLLTMVTRAFSSMPGLASGIARQIREGEVKKYLTQPVDMIGFMFLGRIAHKLAYYTIAVVPFAILFFLCRGYFENGWPGWTVFGAFVLSLMMAFALGYFLETCIGLIGFWLLEVSSLLFIYMMFSFFLSGHMFPLDMLPAPFNTIVDFLPLKYLAYFPAAVFLGKIQGTELAIGLAVQAMWVVAFIMLSHWMYGRGVRRYSGYGG
jgi:ABC-2 type transport system permease protein